MRDTLATNIGKMDPVKSKQRTNVKRMWERACSERHGPVCRISTIHFALHDVRSRPARSWCAQNTTLSRFFVSCLTYLQLCSLSLNFSLDSFKTIHILSGDKERWVHVIFSLRFYRFSQKIAGYAWEWTHSPCAVWISEIVVILVDRTSGWFIDSYAIPPKLHSVRACHTWLDLPVISGRGVRWYLVLGGWPR